MITLVTYQELNEFVVAFGDGGFHLLVVCSAGGLGKSVEANDALDSSSVAIIGGHITPLGLYGELYNNRDKPVVFDEIDGLLSNPTHVGLLKQVAETRSPKRASWVSRSKAALEIDGGVGHFYTTSRVMMLANSFKRLNANICALQTRGMVVRFEPPRPEIYRKIQEFGDDLEVIEFLGDVFEVLREFNLRSYVNLVEMKGAGLDWRRYALMDSDIPSKILEIAELLTRYNSDKERLHHYSHSRRDYFNWKPRALEYAQRHALSHLQDGAAPHGGRNGTAAGTGVGPDVQPGGDDPVHCFVNGQVGKFGDGAIPLGCKDHLGKRITGENNR